jgi:hypothetical protein
VCRVRTNDTETHNDVGRIVLGGISAECSDKEENSSDDGELWMNLHEDSLLRKFGISLDALENDTISKIDPDANNFPMMNHDNNNSQDDAPSSYPMRFGSLSIAQYLRILLYVFVLRRMKPVSFLLKSWNSLWEATVKSFRNATTTTVLSLYNNDLFKLHRRVFLIIYLVSTQGDSKLLATKTTSHYQNAYYENVNESRLGN